MYIKCYRDCHKKKNKHAFYLCHGLLFMYEKITGILVVTVSNTLKDIFVVEICIKDTFVKIFV